MSDPFNLLVNSIRCYVMQPINWRHWQRKFSARNRCIRRSYGYVIVTNSARGSNKVDPGQVLWLIKRAFSLKY
jgi:tRNA U38,U39,U40 pseudouridine synthase TruA